jgi:drug/metabolite transporter (DMT)-like permease
MNKKVKASLLLLNAGFFFVLMAVFIVKSGDLPTMQKTVFRNAIAAIFALGMLLKQRPIVTLDRKKWIALLIRSAFGTIGLVCNFYAIDHLLLADASIIGRLSPFFSIFFSYLILKESVTIKHLIFVTIAFIGSLLVIKPQMNFVYLFPYLVALLGSIGAGGAYTMVRKVGQLGVNGTFVVFFFSAFSCLSNLPFAIATYTPMSFEQVFYLLLTGLSACVAQFSLTIAYYNAPARDISILDYLQIVFAAFFGFILFGQLPDFISICGYIITILGALGMFLYTKHLSDEKEKQLKKV